MPAPAAGIASRIPPQGRQKLTTPIVAAQAGALHSMLSGSLLRQTQPDTVAQPLIEAGYARETFGGLGLTDMGRIRSMMETG